MSSEGRSDAYVKFRVKLADQTNDAFLIERELPLSTGGTFMQRDWIPFSLVTFASEMAISNAKAGDIKEIKLREWKGTELGL